MNAQGGKSYLWNTGDTSKTIEVTPLRTTTYFLTATRGGATDTDSVIVHVENCDSSSTEDFIKDSGDSFNVVVYPNPSEGIFSLNVKGSSEDIFIEVFDFNGRRLFVMDLDAKSSSITQQLNLSGLPKGMYLVKVYNSQQADVKKLLLI